MKRRRGGDCRTIFLVESRLKLVGGWMSARRLEGMRKVLKVSELNHSVKERVYQESLHRKYEVWGGRECGEGVGKVQRYSNGVYQ